MSFSLRFPSPFSSLIRIKVTPFPTLRTCFSLLNWNQTLIIRSNTYPFFLQPENQSFFSPIFNVAVSKAFLPVDCRPGRNKTRDNLAVSSSTMSFRFREFVSATATPRNGTMSWMEEPEKQRFVTRASSYRGEKEGALGEGEAMDVGRWAKQQLGSRVVGGVPSGTGLWKGRTGVDEWFFGNRISKGFDENEVVVEVERKKWNSSVDHSFVDYLLFFL